MIAIMSVQMSVRFPDDLAEGVRREAQRQGKSVNRLVTDVVEAALDPDTAPGEVERLRERLRKAGVLAEFPPVPDSELPDPELLARARKEAGEGKPLSEFLLEDRGEGA